MDTLLRFRKRPITIKRTQPSRREWVAFWYLLALWLTVNAADLITTAALLAAHPSGPSGYYEDNPVGAWALAHGGLAMLVGVKVLYAVGAGFGLRLLTLRWFPRQTLAISALFSLPVAAAVLWNIRLLMLR